MVYESNYNEYIIMTTEETIAKLQKDLRDLTDEVYLNNFTSHRDFNKVCHFNNRLKVPVVASLPTQCDIGEVVAYGGKLYVASAVNTFTIVGTQS